MTDGNNRGGDPLGFVIVSAGVGMALILALTFLISVSAFDSHDWPWWANLMRVVTFVALAPAFLAFLASLWIGPDVRNEKVDQ